jgi:uncharacterized membrane protein
MEINSGIEVATAAFEVAGALALIIGTVIAAVKFGTALLGGAGMVSALVPLRQDIGRAILLALELLVAADILRSVAISPTFQSVGVLGLIVVVRTFLSWTLQVEIDGVWPWQGRGSRPNPPESEL